jgi:hypothetical protein
VKNLSVGVQAKKRKNMDELERSLLELFQQMHSLFVFIFYNPSFKKFLNLQYKNPVPKANLKGGSTVYGTKV